MTGINTAGYIKSPEIPEYLAGAMSLPKGGESITARRRAVVPATLRRLSESSMYRQTA